MGRGYKRDWRVLEGCWKREKKFDPFKDLKFLPIVKDKANFYKCTLISLNILGQDFFVMYKVFLVVISFVTRISSQNDFYKYH